MLGPRLHATFLPSDTPRESSLALWPDPARRAQVQVVAPRDGRLGVHTVPARVVPLRDVLDELVTLRHDAPVNRSVHAWAVVARCALGLVARGRLHPATTDADVDCWRLGPLDPTDRVARAALAGWLPPEAHATPLHGHDPVRITAGVTAVAAFYDAVADLMPRTAAARVVSGQWAFSDTAARPSRELSLALPSRQAERTLVGVRVHLPEADDDTFALELQVRSALDPSLVADAADLWAGRAHGFGVEAEADLLIAIRRAAQVWPPLEPLLAHATPSRLVLDDDHGIELLGHGAARLAAVGIEVLAPATRHRSFRAVAHVEAPERGAESGDGRFDLGALCELTYRPTLDGDPLTPEELSQLAASRRPVVRLRDQWVVVDPAELAKLTRRHEVEAAQALAAALTGEIWVDRTLTAANVAPPLRQLVARLRQVNGPRELPEPDGLEATLRPYQRRGQAWLAEMAELGFGGVLADDMGLGKTVQLIALHLRRSTSGERRPTLVVCPASVVTNWERELARFAPGVPVLRHHGPARDLDALPERHDVASVVVTTYGILRRDVAQLAQVRWGLVVADEAQRVKNPATAAARALRRLPAGARIAMTGTPVENRLTELWSLLDWTTPGLLGPFDRFRREVALPIERDLDHDATDRLAHVVAPFVLRRTKADPDVVPDLPPKIETDHPVVLSVEQAGLYQAVVDESLAQIAAAQGMGRRGLVLKLLTALKQICNHPAHYLGQPGPLPGRSGKLDALDDLLDAIIDAGEASLVFTQYVKMGDLLSSHLTARGIPHRFLHGALPLAAREAMVDEFQAGGLPVFLLSLQAGGTGLNLTQANHVLHYDRWWNPAVEDQASDRAWRIGQERTVQVHRLICDGTIEERIARVLASKAALAEAVVGAGEAWLTELSDAELAELVRLSGTP